MSLVKVAVLSFAAAFLLNLATIAVDRPVEDAQAHVKYCGHRYIEGSKPGPYGNHISYRELYEYGWGAGPHWHNTTVWGWNGVKWVFVHRHDRQCPGHPV